jgi:hypothetical protein
MTVVCTSLCSPPDRSGGASIILDKLPPDATRYPSVSTPDVPLKLARERHDEARKLVARGIDPGQKRRAEGVAATCTFEAVGREWFARRESTWAKSHSSKILARLGADLFPWLGTRPIERISAVEVLTCLRRIEARGVLDTVHRALQNCCQIFPYAVATGRAPPDPCGDLRGALAPKSHLHYPTLIDPLQIGALLRAIDAYTGSMIVRSALRLAPLAFVRPGELCAEWGETSIEKAEWAYPGRSE